MDMPWWLSACQQKNLDKRCMQHNGGRGRSGVVSEGQAEVAWFQLASSHYSHLILRVHGLFALAAYTHMKHLKLLLKSNRCYPLVSMQTERLEMAGVAPVAPVEELESLFFCSPPDI
jgi:hypothetical protein